ncbi:MAG: GH92 family glycosyl hydrolase [Clostridia bacterium]|nr:GH92 family glycosyl hydrolase [Clostridia bacterium]
MNTQYIDPMIGTVGDEQETSLHGGGKTHPGACLPGGMVQLSPDTTTSGDNGTGYNYCQSTIEGFSFNHMSGIGWYGDLGNLQIMPVTKIGDLRSGSNEEVPFLKGTSGWKSHFSHENEIAKAGYYSVKLDDYDIICEATVTMHTGLLRFTYPECDTPTIIFNFSRRIAGHADFESIKIVDNRHIEGHIHCTPKGGGFGRGGGNISYELYFSCELSHPIISAQFFENEEYKSEGLTTCDGEDLGLVARFEKGTEQITIKCAISYTDLDGAKENFKRECAKIDFDTARENADATWQQALDIIHIETDNETDKTLFYTCLYHTLLDPRTQMDADGRFRMSNGEIKRADYTHRTMFSGWDVYRSEFPLLTIIRPDIVNDEVSSLLSIASEMNTSLPRWELMGIDSGCMVGDPGLLVFADAYVKGIRNYDTRLAYEICYASATSSTILRGRPFKSLHPQDEQYKNNAFVVGSLSNTLEFLLADFAMSNLAKAMGNDIDSEYFKKRYLRYKENFNHKTGFMGARDKGGEFIPSNSEYDTQGCVESNIFQQSWFAPYDIEGLSELFGKERAIALLERLFDSADFSALWNENYNHSNEPCHNLTHYFTVLGLPHRTQYWTRRVQKEAYRTGAFGFCGNEDVGQLSAWYVLSALGFAQIMPTSDRLYINTPLFKSASIRLNPTYHKCQISDTFCVECDNDPLDFPYIDRLYLNGNELNRHYITYEELTNGSTLRLLLKREP